MRPNTIDDFEYCEYLLKGKNNMMIKAPKMVDLAQFAPDAVPSETKFGLPLDVKYCKSCVISNQRPNSAVEYKHKKDTKKATINFNENGVCEACAQAERKITLSTMKRATKSCVNCATDTAKTMAATIA